MLKKGFTSIIEKKIAPKETKLVYSEDRKNTVVEKPVTLINQDKFCLSNHQIIQLSNWICMIEEYYSNFHDKWCPMDIEWALDGVTDSLYIVQARPETVHSNKENQLFTSYKINNNINNQILLSGIAVGDSIGVGSVRKLNSMKEYYEVADSKPFNKGDILVTKMTDPNWEPLMKIAGGIVTDKGGRTCHAADRKSVV